MTVWKDRTPEGSYGSRGLLRTPTESPSQRTTITGLKGPKPTLFITVETEERPWTWTRFSDDLCVGKRES